VFLKLVRAEYWVIVKLKTVSIIENNKKMAFIDYYKVLGSIKGNGS
jgi:hypothetical protein